MSANFPSSWQPRRLLCAVRALPLLAVLLAGLASPLLASEEEDAEKAVLKLTEVQEKDGFDFRADIWARELKPDVGKAVRVQMFKGNEYRVCIAVPPQSGVKIAAHVLDTDGKPIETKSDPAGEGWGATLYVKPKRTGVYAVVMRQAESKGKVVPCAMITGYK